ncbi:tape measure protein [Agrobacterium tumefaciens]|uniref:tape measure protein n=1 Tax=Agrobacterium tumefaciens TaxID=358 RepID=UPI0021D0D331|nr:tape measure protein [Agrobacterium tumefaciens]UXT99450.1 hypothetical protein FY129_18370 [Agrobacterium tumefaciens]
MRFAMIFEGVDRATKVMSKIMTAEKRTAQAAQAGAKASASASAGAASAANRHASALAKIGSVARSAYNGVVAGANAAARATVALHEKTVALAKSGFGQVTSGAGKTFRGLALAAGVATAAIGATALAAGSMIGVASQFEKFQTILETTEGSSAKAKTAMNWVADFAAKTPYELDGVTDAFVKLRAYGLDPTHGLMETLGDTSAAMGKPMMQSVEAMADAVTGENERLKEFGVKASKAAGQITYEYTDAAGKMAVATVEASDRMAIQTTLMQIFSQKYGGAMLKLSGTWEGMLSNISDIWSQFQLAVMRSGLFDWMKAKLSLLLETLNQMKAAGTFDVWAKTISDNIVFVLETAWEFGQRVWQIMVKLGGYLQTAATYVGGWERLAVILAGLAFAPALISTAAGIVQIAMGLSMLSAALMANPIALAIAGIVAGAALIYLNWEPIKAFFVDLWNSITAGAQFAYSKLVELTGFDPLSALSGGWASVSNTISQVWASIPPFSWDGVLTALNWLSYIHPIRWLEFIPGFSWSGVISGALDWGSYIVSLDWTKYLPSFSWPEIPAFSWPAIPALELPALPDVAGWIGEFGNAAMSAIEGVSARIGNAWAKVTSAFSFDSAAEINVTDPATILAASEAAAKLSADMQGIAGIDTGPAMDRLAAIEAAANRILPAVTSAVGQAQAYLSGVSFFDQGAALMDTMAAGMRARAAVVVNEIQRMTQMVRDHLPSSPAKVGPLSDIHRLKFGETIAASIRAEPMVRAMRAASAATMAAAAISAPNVAAASTGADAARAQVARASVQSAASSGSGNTYHFSPTVPIPAGAGSPADIKQAVKDALRESGREFAEMMEEEDRRRGRRET